MKRENPIQRSEEKNVSYLDKKLCTSSVKTVMKTFQQGCLDGHSSLVVGVVYCAVFCILITDFLINTFYFCVTFTFKC